MNASQAKLVLMLIALLAVIAGWYLVVYSPVTVQFKPINSEITQIEEMVRSAKEKGGDIEALMLDLSRIRDAAVAFRAGIPSIALLDTVLFKISRSAISHELTIENLDPTESLNLFDNPSVYKPEAVAGLIKMPLDIRIKGKYIDFGRFLEDIREQDVHYSIEEVRIRSRVEDLPVLTVQVVMYLFFRSEEAVEPEAA